MLEEKGWEYLSLKKKGRGRREVGGWWRLSKPPIRSGDGEGVVIQTLGKPSVNQRLFIASLLVHPGSSQANGSASLFVQRMSALG